MKWEFVKIGVETKHNLVSKSSQTELPQESEDRNLLTENKPNNQDLKSKSTQEYKKGKIYHLSNYLCTKSIFCLINYTTKTIQIPEKLHVKETIRIKY